MESLKGGKKADCLAIMGMTAWWACWIGFMDHKLGGRKTGNSEMFADAD